MPFWKSVVPHDAELRQGSRKFKIGEKSFNGYENNKVWRNNGDGTFTEIGWASGGDVIVDCRSCAVGDFDRDGRMDIALRTMYERSFFLRNEGEVGRFLHVRLIGTKGNRMGVGARVEAYTGARRQTGEIVCGSSFFSQHETAVHFGLGTHERVDRLVVRWPSGAVQEFRDVAGNQFLTITEGEAKPKAEGPRSVPTPAPKGKEQDPFVKLLREGKYVGADGKAASGSEKMKELTLLHVWSPTCKGCEKEASTLQAMQKLFGEGPFTVLALAVDTTPEEVRAFVEQHKLSYPVLIADEETGKGLMKLPQVPWSLVARGFGGWFEVGAPEPSYASIPWSGLLDRSGLLRRYRGPIKYFEAKLEIVSALDELRRNSK